MIAPVVELRGVRKTYPGPPAVTVLQPTSLALMPGERVAVVGPSGSGKSTLLSILGTIDDPTEGSVFVAGHDVTGMRESDRSRLRAEHLGFVFQQFHLMPALTALENVATGLLYSGVRAAERRTRAADALAEVGLAGRITHRPGELSGGEQQRVAIARALVRRPRVLFADEPTGALDQATGAEVVSLLAGIAGQGTTVVVVTHDEHVAARFSRRIELRDGVVSESARDTRETEEDPC